MINARRQNQRFQDDVVAVLALERGDLRPLRWAGADLVLRADIDSHKQIDAGIIAGPLQRLNCTFVSVVCV